MISASGITGSAILTTDVISQTFYKTIKIVVSKLLALAEAKAYDSQITHTHAGLILDQQLFWVLNPFRKIASNQLHYDSTHMSEHLKWAKNANWQIQYLSTLHTTLAMKNITWMRAEHYNHQLTKETTLWVSK